MYRRREEEEEEEEEDHNWNKTNDIITPKEQLSFLIDINYSNANEKEIFPAIPSISIWML